MDKKRMGKTMIWCIVECAILLSLFLQFTYQNYMVRTDLAYIQLSIFAIAAILMIIVWLIYVRK